jgi:hypothetical protein
MKRITLMMMMVFMLMMMIVSLSHQQQTGLKVIATEAGVTNSVSETIPELLKLVHIDDISNTQTVPIIGAIDFTLTDIVIDHIDVLPISINCRDKASLNETIFSSQNVVLDLALNWKYSERNFPHASGHGMFHCISDMMMSVLI